MLNKTTPFFSTKVHISENLKKLERTSELHQQAVSEASPPLPLVLAQLVREIIAIYPNEEWRLLGCYAVWLL
jgi:hypothetical protein